MSDTKIIKKTSLADDPLFQAGINAGLHGELTAAVQCFEQLARQYPEDPRAHYELGLAYQRRGEAQLPPSLQQRDAGEASLSSSLSDVVNAFLGLAVVGASKVVGQTDWIVRYREDFRKSSVALEKAISLDENYAPAYHALAHSLRYLGQAEAAAEMARRAAELEPENPDYAARAQNLDLALANQAAQTREVAGSLTWDDVILPERTKRELRQMQLLLENPALSRDLGIEPPTGLLLYGPPGTGKTTIARILAHQAKCRFFATSPAEINSMWLGESEKQVARLFAQARANAPAIVFLDEIDALLPIRTGGINLYSDKVVNQFLHEMDGLVKNRRIFVVGATNRRDMLDPALLRGGRLSRSIEIPLPDEPARAALFALSLRGAKIAEDVSAEELARESEGFSGANIKALVNEAGLQALIRIADTSDQEPDRRLTMADFREALANYTPPAEESTPRWPFFG
jgi:transitional endoplasmic reticulum ATPase